MVVFCVSVCFCLHSSLSFLCCSVCRLVSFSAPAVSRASFVPAVVLAEKRRRDKFGKGGGFAREEPRTGGCRACRVSALERTRVFRSPEKKCGPPSLFFVAVASRVSPLPPQGGKAACLLSLGFAVVGGAGRGRRTSRRGRRPGPCRRPWLGVVLGVIRRGATSGVTTWGA